MKNCVTLLASITSARGGTTNIYIYHCGDKIMEIKGILNYYIYIPTEPAQDMPVIIDLFCKVNQAVFERVNRDSGYQVMVVPVTVKEACRVEKVDFDKAFPRYAKKTHIDFAEEDRRAAIREQDRLEQKREKTIEE